MGEILAEKATSAHQDELNKVLKDKFDFLGAYSFSRTYIDAPNPCIRTSGLGCIGLPLSTRDADAIKTTPEASARRASYGVDNRRDEAESWAIDASQIRIDNTRWNRFLDQATRDACDALGIDRATSLPRYELKYLTLDGPSSVTLPPSSSDTTSGIFATVMIILPSKFSGGKIHISHNSLFHAYDCSALSPTETSVVSWYASAQANMSPITDGYRLALVYNLICNSQSIPPAMDPNSAIVCEVKRVLKSWVEHSMKGGPTHLFHVLEHTYTEDTLRMGTLRGADVARVAIIDALGKRHGVRVGMVKVECILVISPCTVDNCACRDTASARPRSAGVVGAECNRAIVHQETKAQFGSIIDVMGRVLLNNLTEVSQSKGFLVDVANLLATRPPQSQKRIEGGNRIERYYNRTLMLIWPEFYDFIMRFGDQAIPRACSTLTKSITQKPTVPEQTLVKFLFIRFEEDRYNVIEALCQAAYRWQDVLLWAKVIRTCSVDGSPEDEQLSDALEYFGFKAMKSSLEKILHHQSTNFLRFHLLDTVQQWSQDKQSAHGLLWASTQRASALKSLRKPYHDEDKLFVKLATKRGGLEFLKETVLPQVIGPADDSFLLNFAWRIHNEESYRLNTNLRSEVVTSLLSAILEKITFHYTLRREECINPQSWVHRFPYPTLAKTKQCLQLCYAVEKPDVLDSTIKRIIDSMPKEEWDVKVYVRYLMLPVFSFLEEQNRAHGVTSPVKAFEQLRESVISDTIKSLFVAGKMGKQDLEAVIAALIPTPSFDEFASSVRCWLYVSRAESLPVLADVLCVFSKDTSLPASVQQTIRNLLPSVVKRYASCVQLTSHKTIASAVQLCLECDSLQYAAFIIERAVKCSNTTAQMTPYVENVLIPLIPSLREIARKHNVFLKWGNYFKDILVLWLDCRLREVPAEHVTLDRRISTIATWPCGCEPCSLVRQFLTVLPDKSMRLEAVGSRTRKHVFAFLHSFVGSLASWMTIKSNPQGFEVVKGDMLYKYLLYRSVNRDQGRNILNAISKDESERRRILGDQYPRIISELTAWVPYDSQTSDDSAKAARSPSLCSSDSVDFLSPRPRTQTQTQTQCAPAPANTAPSSSNAPSGHAHAKIRTHHLRGPTYASPSSPHASAVHQSPTQTRLPPVYPSPSSSQSHPPHPAHPSHSPHVAHPSHSPYQPHPTHPSHPSPSFHSAHTSHTSHSAHPSQSSPQTHLSRPTHSPHQSTASRSSISTNNSISVASIPPASTSESDSRPPRKKRRLSEQMSSDGSGSPHEQRSSFAGGYPPATISIPSHSQEDNTR